MNFTVGGWSGRLRAADQPSPSTAARPPVFAGGGAVPALRPEPGGDDCTIHEVLILPDRDDVVATRHVILEVNRASALDRRGGLR